MWDRARALAMRKKNDRLVGHRHTYDEMGEQMPSIMRPVLQLTIGNINKFCELVCHLHQCQL